MGYIGLLLNAPYKIDRLMGMILWIMLVVSVFLFFFVSLFLANRSRGEKGDKRP
jgi:hypothetical protein